MTDEQGADASDPGGGTGQAQQTWLQRWGSSGSRSSTAIALLVFALVLGGAIYIGLSAATRSTDERQERARDLDERYVERVDIVVSLPGRPGEKEVVEIDGTPREDCTETEDGFLECTEAPQPTLVR